MGKDVCYALMIATTTSCQAYVGDYEVEETGGTIIPTTALCEVEADALVFDVDLESSESEPDLETYYERANPEFVDHLSEIASLLAAGESHVGVTYLTGAAGVGKSFVMNNGLDAFTDEQRCEIDLPDLFTELTGELDFEVVSMPDLQTRDGDIVFNELPGAEDVTAFQLASLYQASGCITDGTVPPLTVIDGLDELHDDTSRAILSAVDRMALGTDELKGEFFHVIVAGRPAGFSSWLTDPARNEDNVQLVERFDLEAPRYQTGGDLEFRARGYLDFVDQLDSLDASDDLDEYVQSFQQAVSDHPFLTYSIGNLAVGNVAIDQTGNRIAEGEQELKTGLLDDILVRNSSSHNRPGAGSPHDGVYLRLLEDVAAMYDDVTKSGTFVVRSEDAIVVHDDRGNDLGEVRVRNVLNRAGVAVLTTVNSASTRYRFEPFWIHGHLIERRNARLDENYEYVGCEL